MRKIKVANGIWFVDIPEAELAVLCGCPADSVKHLVKRGLISQIEIDGIKCENGPNAVLLSDLSLQGGEFANLAEFPVLQMLYRQGLGLPGHPRYDGTMPMLIGSEEQVRAQSAYIQRGNYGLLSIEELRESGVSAELAEEIMRMKLGFAGGRIRDTSELLDIRPVGDGAVPLRNGASVRRRSSNVYEFSHGASRVEIDLNLGAGERFEPSYVLPSRRIRREYFSVVHIGEGEGWDPDKPSMGSIVIFQGRIYLVDAGPHILDSLTALGIGVNEVEGIFQTHAHDDHFAGLTSLARSDHRMLYYAVPFVRASAARKLSTLMGFSQDAFGKYFKVVDLALGEWNSIDGLEVRPLLSAHPVETTVLSFKARGSAGPSIYAHLADIPAFSVLRSMVAKDPASPGVSAAYRERLEAELLAKADLKKIDAGGGAIHGNALDFLHDESPRIVVSHVTGKLSEAQKEVGSSASFGQEDVLIAGREDYAQAAAYRCLESYFPTEPHNLRMLLNCPDTAFAAGSLILRKGDRHGEIFLVVQGIVEFLDSQAGIHGALSAGSIVGESSALHGTPAIGTFRAASEVVALRIPIAFYKEFLDRSGLYDEVMRVLDNRGFLFGTWILGEMISFPLLRRIAQAAREFRLEGGEAAALGPGLHIIREGRAEIALGARIVDRLGPGDFFCGEGLLDRSPSFETRAIGRVTGLSIPEQELVEVPIVRWKLLETMQRRLVEAASAVAGAAV